MCLFCSVKSLFALNICSSKENYLFLDFYCLDIIKVGLEFVDQWQKNFLRSKKIDALHSMYYYITSIMSVIPSLETEILTALNCFFSLLFLHYHKIHI